MSEVEKIIIECPNCSVKIRVKLKKYDRKADCPKCKQPMLIAGAESLGYEIQKEAIIPAQSVFFESTSNKNIHSDEDNFELPKRRNKANSKPKETASFLNEEVLNSNKTSQNFVAKDSKYCHYCGEKIASIAEICPKCGVRQVSTQHSATNDSDSRKLVAALLAFFLGVFGAHWFYLGNAPKGLIYLLVSILGAPFFLVPTLIISLLSFIDAILLLSMKNNVFQEKYPIT
jgi:TM2 domain-containing membrane protein YozV